mmetsp:Transcript_53488/g.116826  ORF Transcript_53488/g.116826 Transcript_53488/m.116826 type:complete len:245 (+) Transcript_53488:200-934(+)
MITCQLHKELLQGLRRHQAFSQVFHHQFGLALGEADVASLPGLGFSGSFVLLENVVQMDLGGAALSVAFGTLGVWIALLLVQDSAINDDGLCIPQARPEGQHPVVLLSTTQFGAGIRCAADLLNAADGRHPLQHSAKDHVLQIEFGIGLCQNEELRIVGVGPTVRHAQETGCVVRQIEALVVEGATPDRFAPSTITAGDVATLHCKSGHHPVKGIALEVQRLSRRAEAFLSGAKALEVFDGLGH